LESPYYCCAVVSFRAAFTQQKDFEMSKKSPPPSKTVGVHPITSPQIKRISAIGEKTPSKLSNPQVQSLAASVQRHIEPRGGKIK